MTSRAPRILRRQSRKLDMESKPKERTWEAVFKALLVPLIVTALGGWFAQSIAEFYGRQQRLIAEKEAEEKFIGYLGPGNKSNPQQRYLAIQSLIDLQAYDTAADLLVTLPHNYAKIEQGIDKKKKQEEQDKSKHAGQEEQDKSKHGGEGKRDPDNDVVRDPFECSASSNTPEQAQLTTDQEQEDCNFTSLLFRYSKVLLPRLVYRVGNIDDPFGDRSLSAIKVLLTRTDAHAIENIAFTPIIRNAGWWERERFNARVAWQQLIGGQEIEFERRQRTGAILVLKRLVFEDNSRPKTSRPKSSAVNLSGFVDPVAGNWQRAAFASQKYSNLAQPLIGVASTNDPLLYEETARVSALNALSSLYSPPGEDKPLGDELRRIAADKSTPSRIRGRVFWLFLARGNTDAADVEAVNDMISGGICDARDSGCIIWFLTPIRREKVHDAVLSRLKAAGDIANELIDEEFPYESDVPTLLSLNPTASPKRRETILRAIGNALGPAQDERGDLRNPVDVCGQDSKLADACQALRDGLEDSSEHTREAAYEVAYRLGSPARGMARSRLKREIDPSVLTWFLSNRWGGFPSDLDADFGNDQFDCATIPDLSGQVEAIQDPFKKGVAKRYLQSRVTSCGMSGRRFRKGPAK